jgi:nucleoside-diphosphate-sugar epimerase
MLSFRLLSFFVLVRMNVTQSLVCFVTGANGYIGRAIVHELLELSDSQTIYCLVRPHRVTSEQAYWEPYSTGDDCDSFSSKILVLPYDMLDGGLSLRLALERGRHSHDECFVFHVASVFGPTDDHRQTALDNVQGTEHLVRELAKIVLSKAPCKLILTSSMAAVRGSGQSPINGRYYTYQDWNTVSQLGTSWGTSYQWSKVQSERQCIDLCKVHNIPLVVLNPSFVFGPAFRASASSYSLTLVGQWARGEGPVQSRLFVDIRDVAKAHVVAAHRTEAIGQRFILSTEARVPSQTIAGWLKEVCTQTGIVDPDRIHFDADFDGGAIPIGAKEVDATDRLARELGIVLRPVKETIMDMARGLLDESA